MYERPSGRSKTAVTTDALGLLAVLAIYGLSIATVGLKGDFPLNDDWSYAAAVRSLVIDHNWRPSGWTSTTLITHSLFSAPFCLVGDCSYDNLRLSSLTAASLLVVLSYLALRWAKVPAWYGIIGTVVVALNPLAFPLQFTFMTETVFATLLFASLFSFAIYLRDGRMVFFWTGLALAIVATLCRQLGLSVAFAFGVTCFLQPGRITTRRLAVVASPAIACVAALLMFNAWMKLTGRTPALYGAKNELIAEAIRHPVYFVQRVAWNSSVFLLYLGLITSPLMWSRVEQKSTEAHGPLRFVPIALSACITCILVAVLIARHSLMPISGNILTSFGIGPMLLPGTDATAPAQLPIALLVMLTMISLIGASRLVYVVTSYACVLLSDPARRRVDPHAATALLCGFTIAIYFAPIASITFYDRYIMPVIAIAGLLLVICTSNRTRTAPIATRRALELGCCAFLVIYTVLGTHDLMNWNRARWLAINELKNVDHATAHDIDGGLEFNGAELYDPNYVAKPGRSIWWIDRDTYRITPRPIAGETVLRRYAYHTYLMPGTRYLYVMKSGE